ncbi:HNH endonuclease [Candidatus Pacearchaeota archaeon]|nr:HNH endonuclease [Candidatus Pacearchaeota archaeon]
MKRIVITDSQVAQILQLYPTPMSMTDVGKVVGLPYGHVSRVLKKNGVNIRTNAENQKLSHQRPEIIQKMRKGDQKIDLDEAIHLYNVKKWSMKDVAEKYGVEPRVLTLRFKEGGIEIRGNQAAQKISAKREHVKEQNSRARRYSVDYLKIRHPFFCTVEEIQTCSKTGKVQVHCKNNKCQNSKEKNGWFTPTGEQVLRRCDSLEKPEGNDGSYFYCSDECKRSCELYGLNPVVYLNRLNGEDTSILPGEYEIFREEVKQRNVKKFGQLQCEKCENLNVKELEVHHEKPKKTHSGLSLDPDNGWVLCGRFSKKKCHLKIGHSDRHCTTGYLSSQLC